MKNLRLESWGNQSEYHDRVVEHELEPGASDWFHAFPLTSHSHSGSWTWVVINAQVIVHGGACRYQNLFLATRGYVPVTSKQAHHSREMRQTPNPRMENKDLMEWNRRGHGTSLLREEGPNMAAIAHSEETVSTFCWQHSRGCRTSQPWSLYRNPRDQREPL